MQSFRNFPRFWDCTMGDKHREKRPQAGKSVEPAERAMELQDKSVETAVAEDTLFKAHRAIKALSECNHALIHIDDETDLLQEICRIIVEVGGYRMAWVGYAEQDLRKTVTSRAKSGYEQGYLQALNITWEDNERGRGPVGAAIRTRTPSIVRYVQTHPEFEPWRPEAVKRGYASIIGLPLFLEKHILGCLAIYAAEPDAFDWEEVNLLKKLADNLSYGIEGLRSRKARRLAEEALQGAYDDLERRVGERTAELIVVNEELHRQIRERHLIEAKLRRSEERYRLIFNHSPVGIMHFDQHGTIIDCNEKFGEIIGGAKEAIVGFNMLESLRDDAMRQAVELALRGEIGYFEGEYFSVIGHKRATISAIYNKITSNDGSFLGGVGIFEDITQRKQAEQALQMSRERLRHLLSQQIAAQEQERRRLSIELHDELGQSLMVLKLQVGAIEKRLKKGQQELKQSCLETLHYIDEIIENVRRLSRDLSPLILENLGLSSALRWLCEDLQQAFSV